MNLATSKAGIFFFFIKVTDIIYVKMIIHLELTNKNYVYL